MNLDVYKAVKEVLHLSVLCDTVNTLFNYNALTVCDNSVRKGPIACSRY